MDFSNYNRREKGKVKINKKEWKKLANILETPIQDIFESEETMFIVCKD